MYQAFLTRSSNKNQEPWQIIVLRVLYGYGQVCCNLKKQQGSDEDETICRKSLLHADKYSIMAEVITLCLLVRTGVLTSYGFGYSPQALHNSGGKAPPNLIYISGENWIPRVFYQIYYCVKMSVCVNAWILLNISIKYSRIGSDNGLVPTRRQVIIWTNDV